MYKTKHNKKKTKLTKTLETRLTNSIIIEKSNNFRDELVSNYRPPRTTFTMLNSPFIFATNRHLHGTVIIHNVENFANLLRCLLLDGVFYSLASKIQQILDVQIVSSQDEIVERVLINLDKFCIPLLKFILRKFFIGIGSINMLLAILNNHSQDLTGNLRNRDYRVVGTLVVDQKLDSLRFKCHGLLNFEGLTVGTLEDDLLGQ